MDSVLQQHVQLAKRRMTRRWKDKRHLQELLQI